MHHVNEVLGTAGPIAVTIPRRVGDVHADVILEQDGHQPVGRAARRDDQLHDARAVSVLLERPLDGVHLAT